MAWDFVENNPFAGAAGDLGVSIDTIARAIEKLPSGPQGTATQADATNPLGTSPEYLVATDPPYYDNIGYADLADFFYVWQRRALKAHVPDLFETLLTPKTNELIASPYRFNGSREAADAHFEGGLLRSFSEIRKVMNPEFPFTVFYAFKQAEDDGAVVGLASTGWETMLDALLDSGFVIDGTWPMRTERGVRSVAIGTAALASSIVLVARQRSELAPLANRKEFVQTLKAELPRALRHLQQGNIAPVDLAQAAIGPGMGVFSRYSKVVEADGRSMTVRTALGLINQVLDETLAEQESDFDADTRWALSWFEQFGMNPGPFGSAETLSKAKNTAVNALVAAGFLESKGGKVRLLDREELASTWDPATDTRLTVWEVTQHLMRVLESSGEAAAAELLRRVGGLGETARELAYRLYVLCERKKWAKEALAYNGLVVAWPEVARLAAGEPVSGLIQDTLL